MHSTSQGGSMAATLLQQKTYMNGLAVGAGGPDGTTLPVPTVAGGPSVAPSTTTAAFLPVSKTLIHHLLPNHHTADHHAAPHGTLLHSSGTFVVVSSTPTAHGGNVHHRTEQYHRTSHRGSSIGGAPYGTLTAGGCEDPPASALDEIFSPLPRQPESPVHAAANAMPLEMGTDSLWDAIGSPTPVTCSDGSVAAPFATTTTAIGQCQPPATTHHTTTPTNHASINNAQQPDCTAVTAAADGSEINHTEQPISSGTTVPEHGDDQQEPEPEPEIDIVINNVVCSFSVRCHLNLHDIALNGDNVEFRRENGMVTMKLRRPYTTASIWSSGKITCTGATSEDQAKVAARRYSRCLQKLGFNVRLRNFRIVNVLGTCAMPWGIKIVNFSEKYKKDASYEPELHPGVTYKLHSPRATLKIFSTGSITVTAASVAYVQAAIEHIFPLVYEFRKKRTPHEKLELLKQPPAFDPHELDMQEDGEVDLLAATTAGTAAKPEEEHEDDDLVSEDYEMREESDETAPQAPSGSQSGNTKAIDKSNSIRATGCVALPAKGGCAPRFVR